MSMTRKTSGLFLVASVCWLNGLSVHAQAAGNQDKAEECDKRSALEKVAWAKSGPHDWVSSDFNKQHIESKQTWCHIWATKGYDRVHKIEDFGRVLLTGEGVHPIAGSIVPNSGFAGGLALNLGYDAKFRPVRLSGSAEARGSTAGFWEAGGSLDLLGSGKRLDNRHIDVKLSAIHRGLPQIDYFGLGNSTSLANESLFGLADTTIQATSIIPLPRNFRFLSGIEGLWSNPQGFHGSTTPSIEQVFNPANTPALSTSTAYFIYGVGVDWKYPLNECLQCWYKTDVTGNFRSFVEATGTPYSFRRFDLTWDQVFTPFPQVSISLGTVSVVGRLIASSVPAGNQVPFYLQPTLGGTDINNFDVLRSYHDYRFRAPNALSFQAEYTRTIWDPLGALFFYDVGKVALVSSDLGISHMRHSFGAGVTLRAGNATLFKLYYAWAGLEGTHTTYTGNTNNFAADPNLRGVF
jgi:hypothetical protein